MVLDFEAFRDDNEDPDALKPADVRAMQASRFKNVAHVDKVVESYAAWRKCKPRCRIYSRLCFVVHRVVCRIVI